MIELIARSWWVVAMRGLCALLFGVVALAWPGATLASLLLLFGAYAAADGMLAIVGLFTRPQSERRWVLALSGLVGIAAGLLALAWPGLTMLALLYLVAAWAILIGSTTIVAAIELRKVIESEWLLTLSGAAALLLGLGVAAYPAAAALMLLGLLAAYAIVAGCVQIALGLRLRGIYSARQQIERPA